MSSILKNKLFLVAGFGLVIGGLGSLFWHAASREPASMLRNPNSRPKLWADSLFGKMNQAMTVKVTSIGGIPDHDDQELHLRAEVTLNQSIEGEVKFQWTLPSEASVVSGELEDSWTGLKIGQTATTEITVTNVSQEGLSKTIFFHAMGNIAGINLGGVGALGIDKFASSASNFAVDPIEDRSSNSEKSANAEERTIKQKNLSEKFEKTHQ